MTSEEILKAATPRPWKHVDVIVYALPYEGAKREEASSFATRRLDVALTLRCVNAYERDQETICALAEALELALNVGGLGHSGSGVFDRDEFYCEICNSHHEHWALIIHTPECKIWKIRKALCDAIGNEEMAGFYIEQSGTRRHTSDCSTSCAPAEVPGPCDCAEAIAESDAALAQVQP